MEQELKNFVIEVPEISLGDVLGKLNDLGAWLVDSTEGANGHVRVEARIATEHVETFKSWFGDAIGGKGSVSENA